MPAGKHKHYDKYIMLQPSSWKTETLSVVAALKFSKAADCNNEGWLSVLECAFWGFLLLFALLHLFPLLRLFVTTATTEVYGSFPQKTTTKLQRITLYS